MSLEQLAKSPCLSKKLGWRMQLILSIMMSKWPVLWLLRAVLDPLEFQKKPAWHIGTKDQAAEKLPSLEL